MKFKTKMIAGACLAVCSASSFAATAVCSTTAPATSAAAVDYVNGCAPDFTVFVGGASTQSSNFVAITKAKVFDLTKMTPVVVYDNGSVSGIGTNTGTTFSASKSNVRALFGQNSSGKKVFVVFNFNNGSAAGVSQVLYDYGNKNATSALLKSDIPESDVVFVGPTADGAVAGGTTANTCVAGSDSTDLAPTVVCTSHAPQKADLSLSDVLPSELYALYSFASSKAAKVSPLKLSTLTNKPLFIQSFGVAVSPALYTALQIKNGLSGCTLPATSDTPSQIANCQPSITSAEYASLVSKGGKIKTLADLTGDTGLTSQLTLARRDDLSGTQAASNMFFVNGQCAPAAATAAADTKSVDAKVNTAGGLFGALPIVSSSNSTGSLSILAAPVSGDVKNAVANSGYAIGVLNVGGGGAISNSDTSITSKGRFVKVDGISPNYYGGQADSRSQIINASYPFAFTAYASYNAAAYKALGTNKTGASAGAAAYNTQKKAVIDGLIAGFSDSTVGTVLGGVAYLDGATNAYQAKFGRISTALPVGTVTTGVTTYSNCQPIVKL
jgi:hypothetical protein